MINQTPWFERKFDFNFPLGIYPVIIERLRGTIPQLEHLLKNATEEKIVLQKEAKWSIKEQIGHLYDLEELWYGRVEDFMNQEKVLRTADLQNRKTHEANHNSKSLRALLDQFFAERKKLVARVKDLSEADISRTALHPRLQQPMRLIDSLYFVAEHDDHHLAKINSLL